jgi:hypothetical protein
LLRFARNDIKELSLRGAKQSRSTGAAPVITVHSLAHAVAALSAAAEAGRPVTLASAPDAGIYAGPGWFGALIAAAREAVPAAQSTALLDCGDDAGAAQAAIRAGIEGIIFTGRANVAERLADIAGQRGVRLLTKRPAAALDLSTKFFAPPEVLYRGCTEILASPPTFC